MSRILTSLRRDFLRQSSVDLLFTKELPQITFIPHRTKYEHNRHRDPKYKLERGRKLWKIELPDFDKDRKEQKIDLTPEEIRSKMKEKGIAPTSPWDERELYTPCTLSVIEPYDPKENMKSSSLMDKIKLPLSAGKEKVKKMREVSSIRSFEGEDFDLKEFAESTTNIYIKAHEALMEKDENKLFDYITEHCFPKMTAGLRRHTIVWRYLGDVERPEAVQVRSGDLLAKGNKYTQITVKMHTKQILAVYDRHGRLVHGSPTEVKEVLEYIVFEKYLANEYGLWRMHDRIRHLESQESFSQQVSKTFVINKS